MLQQLLHGGTANFNMMSISSKLNEETIGEDNQTLQESFQHPPQNWCHGPALSLYQFYLQEQAAAVCQQTLKRLMLSQAVKGVEEEEEKKMNKMSRRETSPYKIYKNKQTP